MKKKNIIVIIIALAALALLYFSQKGDSKSGPGDGPGGPGGECTAPNKNNYTHGHRDPAYKAALQAYYNCKNKAV